MGLFDAYATPVEDIQTGFGFPAGTTAPVVLSDTKTFEKKDGTNSVLLTFTATDGPQAGRTHDVWLTIPVEGEKNSGIAASVMKQWLGDIGIPQEAMNSWDPDADKDKVIGTEGIMKVVNGKANPNGGFYTKVSFAMTAGESGVSKLEAHPVTPTEASLAAVLDPTPAASSPAAGFDPGKWD